MIHELLFALAGCPGSIFVDEGETIKVQEGLPFLHPSQVQLLNRLCQLATYFRQLEDFVKKYGDSETKSSIHGLYLKAFCIGLDSVLDDYRETLQKLELEALKDPYLPVTHLLCCLQEFQLLFPALSSLVSQLVSHKAHGCYILELLHNNAITGLPVVKEAILRILHICHRPLFKQLCAWMLHGTLVDPYEEFFIQATETPAALCSKDRVHSMDTMFSADDSDFDDEKLEPESDSEKIMSQQFTLRAHLLPVYIEDQMASRILFIGESMQMFKAEKVKPEVKKMETKLRSQEDNFAKELYELSKQKVFNPALFRETIDKIRSFVAEQVWILVVEEGDLLGHLKVLKDFYLLGRGELYLAFIDIVHPHLRNPPLKSTQHDINELYQVAARNVLFENESHLQRFSLTIKVRTQDEKGGGNLIESGWNALGMKYNVQWPLQIYFSSAVLEKYERIFKFLLKVRCVQSELQQCWVLQMQEKRHVTSSKEAAVWKLRTHLAFLIDNIQYYLQVDVIESLFIILIDKIKSVHDFEEAKRVHEQFLSKLLELSFFNINKVSHNLLEGLLGNCMNFCKLVLHDPGTMTTRKMEQIDNIRQEFQKQFRLFFVFLSNSQTRGTHQNIGQLLLRLDFNNYITASEGYLGKFF